MNRAICKACVAWGVCLLLWGTSSGLAAMDVDREFEFASGLVEMGFPDLAERVVDDILALHPGERERATRIQGEILLQQRDFDGALEMMRGMPERDPQRFSLQLNIANAYFRRGELEKAQNLYDEFFDDFGDETPTDPDLVRFFQSSVYQYGKMLEQMGERVGATEAYRRLLNVGLDDESAERRLQIDLARLYLRLGREASGSAKDAYLNQAFELCEEVQWGGYDLWFGRSISIMAQVELARGDESAARSLIRRYMDDLNRLDSILREQNIPIALSPVADARFLLGELYEQQVEKLRQDGAPEREVLQAIQLALTEYYNVFGKYGVSEYGSEAGSRGRALVELLEEEYGRSVNIDFGEHLRKAAEAQFAHADGFFRQNEYQRAIEEYLRVLNSFPETEPSLRALANLLLSYVNIGDDLYVRMMSRYLAERFGGEEVLGNALLLAGRQYVEQENEEMYYALFDDFFDGFPDHSRAPALLFDLARRRDTAGDREGAYDYYERIVAQYTDHRFALRALFAMANDSRERDEHDEATGYLKRYLEEVRPGHDRVRAQFMLADSHKEQEKYVPAIQAYGQILRWMGEVPPPDNVRDEEVEKNERLAERALFFVGFCYARMREPEERVEVFRERSISTYRQFLQRYPESSLAPPAMRDMGAMQLALGQADNAANTFERLAEKYPDSEEGRSALFALVSSAFEIGEEDIARDAFQRMIQNPDDYSAREFTRVGQLMLEAGFYNDVIPAYRRVVETTDERRMLELALFGLGDAYVHRGDYAEAVSVLTDLTERYPNTSFLFDAKFLVADAKIELEEYDQAMATLGEIMRGTQDNVVNQKAQYKLGIVQRLTGARREALASFQRIALLQDPNNPDLRSIIEDSMIQSLELMMEKEMYLDVQDVSEEYMDHFRTSDRVREVRDMRSAAQRRAVQ